MGGDVDPSHPYRRSLLIAVAPECGDAEARARHPRLRPGKPVLWLELEIVAGSVSETKVVLVLPPLPRTSCEEIVSAFYNQHWQQVTKIATPYAASRGIAHHTGGTNSYYLMEFGHSDGVRKTDWTQQCIAGVAERTPAWLELFAPLTEQCRKAITPTRLGRMRLWRRR